MAIKIEALTKIVPDGYRVELTFDSMVKLQKFKELIGHTKETVSGVDYSDWDVLDDFVAANRHEP
jgi:hypothetical protein